VRKPSRLCDIWQKKYCASYYTEEEEDQRIKIHAQYYSVYIIKGKVIIIKKEKEKNLSVSLSCCAAIILVFMELCFWRLPLLSPA
jgi:hypothetical protein